MNYHLCIIYDGIANSVFESQLLAPFAQHVAQQKDNHGLLISFERSMPQERYLQIVTAYPNIKLIILKKIPFLGSISLRYAAYQLEKAVAKFMIASVRARGPLAGWIAGHAKSLAGISTVIQARGLAGQEYAYANLQQSKGKQAVHKFRTWQYENIERWAYGTYARQPNVLIHAISNALQDYLIKNFATPANKITVERYDIPAIIDQTSIKKWRSEIRAQLNIQECAYVYVYSGSAKAWQCPRETIDYFAQQYARNTHNFLLILSQDASIFQQLCTQHNLPKSSYAIMAVPYAQIYRYLAAANAGFILRESHPINWVSRPTKILEYQAVGLRIIHNSTIEFLWQNERVHSHFLPARPE